MNMKIYIDADDYLVTLQVIMEDGPGMAMIGGWTPSADPSVTDELKALFEKHCNTDRRVRGSGCLSRFADRLRHQSRFPLSAEKRISRIAGRTGLYDGLSV